MRFVMTSFYRNVTLTSNHIFPHVGVRCDVAERERGEPNAPEPGESKMRGEPRPLRGGRAAAGMLEVDRRAGSGGGSPPVRRVRRARGEHPTR